MDFSGDMLVPRRVYQSDGCYGCFFLQIPMWLSGRVWCLNISNPCHKHRRDDRYGPHGFDQSIKRNHDIHDLHPIWLVVEPTHLKHISQIGLFPQIGMNINKCLQPPPRCLSKSRTEPSQPKQTVT